MHAHAAHPGDDLVRAEIRARLDGLVAIYRFGSSVRGETHGDSDVDIAVLARAPLAPLARFDLQERVAGKARDSYGGGTLAEVPICRRYRP